MPEDSKDARRSSPADATTSAEASTVTTSQSTLDSLFSPTSEHTPLRESVAVSDTTDDDAGFSTVALSARQSLESSRLSLGSNTSESAKDDRRRTIALDSSDVATLVNPEESRQQHKKSASVSTILSANNVPFLLSRLDLQKAQDEDSVDSRRSSRDSQQKLQEEFNRVQNDVHVATPTVAEDSIDWGMFMLFSNGMAIDSTL